MMRVLALLLGAALAAPSFPKEYTAVMTMKLPYIDMTMNLKVHDGTVGSSRRQVVEYYDGLQVDVHDGATGDYKYAFTTVSNGASKRRCLHNEEPHALRAGDDASFASFLPDLSTYEYAGDALVGGILCQKYVASEKHGSAGTMDDALAFYWDEVLKKPVRWHMHSRNKIFSSHTDEYIVDYISFDEIVDTNKLAMPMECKDAAKKDVTLTYRGLFRSFHARAAPGPADTFDAFLAKHGRSYPLGAEYEARKKIFTANVEMIARLNEQHKGKTTFKANQFLDMTAKEVLRYKGGKSTAKRSPAVEAFVGKHAQTGKNLPKNFDWRTAKPGVVSRIKDQGVCGSCWTFSLISSLESIQAKQTGNLIDMPEQFVLDCGWTDTSNACDGGLSDDGAYNIVHKFGGFVPRSRSYGSYLSVDGYCKDTRRMETGVKITGWKDVKERDEQAVMDALVSEGVLSIGITVPAEMVYYDTGVLDVASCEDHREEMIDHAVNLVGYGTTEDGVDYWTVRNSWSEYWGDQGYIRVRRGARDCAVSSQVGYPTIETLNTVTV